MCLTQFETIEHSLKNVGPSQKTLRPSWCPKLVTGLVVIRLNRRWSVSRPIFEYMVLFTEVLFVNVRFTEKNVSTLL